MADISSNSEAIEGPAIPYRKVLVWAAWLAMALLLWVLLKDLPLADAWRTIRGIEVWKVTVLVGVNLVILLLMGLRWWVILRAFGQQIPFSTVLGYRIAGFGVSYFTPGPQIGGEPLQVLLLRRSSVPSASAVTSVLFDKVLELLTNFLFVLLGLMTALLNGMIPQGYSIWVWVTFPILILLPIVHLWMLRRGRYPFTGLIRRFQLGANWKGLEKFTDFVNRGEDLIAEFLRERPVDLGVILLVSGGILVVSIFEFWLLFFFLGAQTGWVQIISILTAGRLAFLLPIPGGFGTLEAGLVYASQLAGLSAALGLAAGLVIHLRDILVGLVGLLAAGWYSRSTIIG